MMIPLAAIRTFLTIDGVCGTVNAKLGAHFMMSTNMLNNDLPENFACSVKHK